MLDKAKCTVELFTINYVWVAISGTVRDHKSQQSSKKMTHGTLQTQKNKTTRITVQLMDKQGCFYQAVASM